MRTAYLYNTCHVLAACSELQRQYKLENNRKMPDWGKEIFSDLCIITRPEKPEDLANFLKYTIALTQAHLQLAKQTTQMQQNRCVQIQHISVVLGHDRLEGSAETTNVSLMLHMLIHA